MAGYHYRSDIYQYYKYKLWAGSGTDFICFRYTKNDQTKYGWLKLTAGAGGITIFEYYVQ